MRTGVVSMAASRLAVHLCCKHTEDALGGLFRHLPKHTTYLTNSLLFGFYFFHETLLAPFLVQTDSTTTFMMQV